MVLVPAKHGCGVPQVAYEDAVEEFASDAADEAFGDPSPVGAENAVRSCDLHVFVYEAAEPVSA